MRIVLPIFYFLTLILMDRSWALDSPCIEYYKRAALENKAERNDEKIALEMLYSEATLETLKTESYFFLKNAVYDLSKDKITSSFGELQAYIHSGFTSGEFCKDAKPKKSAGQIIRIAKDEVKKARYEEKSVAKLFAPASAIPVATGSPFDFDSERLPSSGKVPEKKK